MKDKSIKNPTTSFGFVAEWFEHAAKTASSQGKRDSAILWKDGLEHLTFMNTKIAALEAEVKDTRMVLLLGHGHKGQYLDDGEMQCSECGVSKNKYDYKRNTLPDTAGNALSVLKAEVKRMKGIHPDPCKCPCCGQDDCEWHIGFHTNEEFLEQEIKRLTEEREFCICAAIKDTTGYVWRGHRHADCISSALEAERKIPMGKESQWQGFVTSTGRFVNRYEGYKLQIAAKIPSATEYRNERLFSEDLY